MEAKLVTNEKELDDAYSIRRIVFILEQKVPEDIEIDEHEKEAKHFVLYEKGKPIGAGRLRIMDGIGKVERICVLKEERKKGAGKVIMDKIEEYAKQSGITKLKLHAQTHAIPFYCHLGYDIVSDVFYEAGIPHKTMVKEL